MSQQGSFIFSSSSDSFFSNIALDDLWTWWLFLSSTIKQMCFYCCVHFLGLQDMKNKKNVIMNTHNKHKKPEERFPIFMTQQWHQIKPNPRNVSFHSERISFGSCSAVYDPTIQLNQTTCFWINKKNKSNKKKALNFFRLSWPLTRQCFVV